MRELPFYLSRDVGQRKSYTGNKLLKIYKRYSFPDNYLKYAYALVSSHHEYTKAFGIENGNSYSTLRSEIAEIYFQGNIDFTFSDLMSITKFKAQVYATDGSENYHGDRGGDGD